jgi:hypothetical protein
LLKYELTTFKPSFSYMPVTYCLTDRVVIP